jgi:hypothetical protein
VALSHPRRFRLIEGGEPEPRHGDGGWYREFYEDTGPECRRTVTTRWHRESCPWAHPTLHGTLAEWWRARRHQ